MDIRIPPLGEGADSGTVASIFVKEGDTIRKDDPIIELESEKAVASIPSPAAGRVTKVHVRTGETVRVGTVILSVAEAGAAAKPVESAPVPVSARKMTPSIQTPVMEKPEPLSAEEESASPSPSGSSPAASPSIRKLARQLGIDLTKVRGSERGGRIVMEDLRAYIVLLQKNAVAGKGAPAKTVPPPAEKIDFSKWGGISKKPVTQLRRVIAQRMHESWNAIPHVTQFHNADITNLNALRKKYAPKYEKKGAHLTLTPLVMKAVVETLKKHPMFNASLDEAGGEIVLKEYFHIGVAVDTEHGLMVPVVRDVDKKSLLDLSKEVADLAEKAKQRKLAIEEMKGGSFTISNQGGIGGGHFTPIINQPEVAILGLGRGALKPVAADKKVAVRLLLPLCLSYDHRVIDGGSAARFIVDLTAAIEGWKEKDVKL